MNSDIRRFAELIAYVVVLAMLLASGIVSLKLGTSSDIFLGGVMAGIVPTIQAIARIGQSESMNTMASMLGQSVPHVPQEPNSTTTTTTTTGGGDSEPLPVVIHQPEEEPVPVKERADASPATSQE